MKFCSYCGAPVQPTDRFCTGCGKPVEQSETAEQAANAAPVEPAPAAAQAAVPPSAPVPVGAPVSEVQTFPQPAKSFKGPSRKVIILSSAGLLVVVLALVGLLVVQNILRGGADSPAQAADKVITSISQKDMVGLFTMVTPRERDAVQRTQDALLKKYEEFGIADAVERVTGKSSTGKSGTAQLDLSGITVAIKGTQPRVEEISADLAAVTLDTGEIKWSVDPAKTKGILHAYLAAAGTTKKVSGSVFIADLVKGHGITLMATKNDGRWYISPLLSGLENVSTAAGSTTRGTVPKTLAKGADSPEAAAEAGARALPGVQRDGLKALAPYLSEEEAQAVYLYGGNKAVQDSYGQLRVTLGDASFTAGPQSGDRALAFIDHLSIVVGDPSNNKVTITSNCVSVSGQSQKTCLNGSGYQYNGSAAGISIYADHGKFGLTTVKENGGWKVSVLDTAADHAISWVNSLTREQALSILGLARAEKPAGTLSEGTARTVKFNSAGYAVTTLTVSKAMKLQFADDTVYGEIYSTGGKTELDSISSEYGSDTLKPGTYTLVLKAGSRWEDAFAKRGNSVAYSTSVKLIEYIEPPTINGSTGNAGDTLYSSSNGTSYDVQVPKGNDVNLVLTLSSVDTSVGSSSYLVVSVDGNDIQVPLQAGATKIVPLPADSDSHAVAVSINSYGYDYASAVFTLGFEKR